MSFSDFFGKKEKEPADFSTVMVDLHSHLIPGIDDGAKNLEESVELARYFTELGFKKIITTPHVMMDYYRNTPSIIREGLQSLTSELKRQNIDLIVEAAAEYYLDETLEETLAEKDIMTINGEYILFEFPFLSKPPNYREVVFQIQTLGFKPLLAHPERYPFFYNHFDDYEDLKELGCFFQLNTVSLTGYYNKEVKRIGEKLIDADMIDFIGSDMHKVRHAEQLRKALSEKHLSRLLNSGKLLNSSLL